MSARLPLLQRRTVAVVAFLRPRWRCTRSTDCCRTRPPHVLGCGAGSILPGTQCPSLPLRSGAEMYMRLTLLPRESMGGGAPSKPPLLAGEGRAAPNRRGVADGERASMRGERHCARSRVHCRLGGSDGVPMCVLVCACPRPCRAERGLFSEFYVVL